LAADTACVRLCATLLAMACAAAVADLPSITGSVKRVLDGDSMIVRADGRDVEVRLGEIDTPEKGQPYADSSRKALQGMVLGRRVRLEVLDQDRYGRTVARVYRLPEELWVNAELVRRGHAWAYRRHVRDKRLYDFEREAKEKGVGLWALPEAEREPPWKWRRMHPPQHAPESRSR
jgi:endonuclease YncB( thermonuclease family)